MFWLRTALHIGRIVLGILLLILGVIGLFLPVLQGVLFLMLGVLVLGRDNWLGRRIHARVRRLRAWIRARRMAKAGKRQR